MEEKQILASCCLMRKVSKYKQHLGFESSFLHLCEYSSIGRVPDFQSGGIGSNPIIRSNSSFLNKLLWTNWLSHCPFTAKIAGSSPVGSTSILEMPFLILSRCPIIYIKHSSILRLCTALLHETILFDF